MLYVRFSPISRNTWGVSAPVKSSKPIANITRRRGRCFAKSTPGHTLSREELLSLTVFMEEHERAN
jgi:hypothetical protein